MEDNERYKIINGDSLKILDTIEPNSIDAIITDPPYELGFMGKKWDATGIAYNVELWKKAFNVLKSGGFLLAFGGSRTFHRIACAIEDAGFEIRDTIMWLYGSGFPKSFDLGKAVESKILNGSANTQLFRKLDGELIERGNYGYAKIANEQGARPADYNEIDDKRIGKINYQTEEGKKWDGWGTALKPAYEPIIVARKPVEESVVNNILKYGVGGINIEECRVGNEIIKGGSMPKMNSKSDGINIYNFGKKNAERIKREDNQGRFPANVILTYDDSDAEEVCSGMPDTKSAYNEDGKHETNIHRQNADILKYGYSQRIDSGYNDEGSAARYFYCAKASKKDRDAGLTQFEEISTGELQGGRKEGSAGSMMLNADGTTRVNPFAGGGGGVKKNFHPTVKPVELMQYLVRLVVPAGGAILDIFNGSGSTGKAVAFENRERNKDYKYIGIELDAQYCEISRYRIDYALHKFEYDMIEDIKKEEEKTGQLSLFDFNGENDE